jgi:hypothetical protein
MFNFTSIIAADVASICFRLPIPNFPGYSADTDGNIFSDRRSRLRILKPVVRRNGYLAVKLKRADGRLIDRYVHQLVAETFHGPRPSPDHVAAHHPNPDKADCRAENVMWATRVQNIEQWLATEPRVHGGRKLNPGAVRDIRRRHASGVSNRQLADDHGVGLDTIRGVLTGRVWRHVR